MIFPAFTASLIMSAQVKSGELGSIPAAFTAALRYHKSWVLAQNGAATSLPAQNTVFSGAARTPLVSSAASASLKGRRKPALANSATNGGSRLIRSIELSLAARRRTSCSRCEEASLGRVWMLTLYGPPEGAHFFASRACPPLSGLMYQVRVGTPPLEPHPATGSATSATQNSATLLRPIRRGSRGDHQRGFFMLGLPSSERVVRSVTLLPVRAGLIT